MIEVYKMLNILDRVEFDRLFVRDMSNTRGHNYKLDIVYSDNGSLNLIIIYIWSAPLNGPRNLDWLRSGR